MKRIFVIAAMLPMLSACDQLKDRMGIPDPAKIEAEGKAIGGGCRYSGRGLEDCYKLNPRADKAAVFAGWKEMNEYMIKNNMQALPPSVPDVPAHKPAAVEPAKDAHAAEADKKADGAGKAAGH